ncbi:MAG: site-2 protease family protein [Rhodothalassiaceae bacterium]
MSDLSSIIVAISVWALPVLFAVTFHEAAHGFVANALGDDTARMEGRLTLNPFAHIDPFGTILLPLMLLAFTSFAFGYARPVPVNPVRLGNPRRDMILVALAGPAANLLLALLAAILLPILATYGGVARDWAIQMLGVMVFFNCLIAVFNLLPIPPLDGGRVVHGLLPSALARRYTGLEQWGMLIVVGGLFLLPMLLRELGIGFNPANWLVLAPADTLYRGIMGLVGIS